APKIFSWLSVLLAAKPDPVIIFEMPGELTLQPAGWLPVKRLGKGAHQPTVVNQTAGWLPVKRLGKGAHQTTVVFIKIDRVLSTSARDRRKHKRDDHSRIAAQNARSKMHQCEGVSSQQRAICRRPPSLRSQRECHRAAGDQTRGFEWRGGFIVIQSQSRRGGR